MEINTLRVECPCGAVAIDLTGEPLLQFYCHCDDCQLVHGAACVPVVMYPASAVSVARGEPVSWQLRRTPRRSCSACGTRLFAEPNPRLRGVIASLLPPGRFVPEFHIHCGLARVPVKDALPHYRTLPARLGGSDELVDW